jgi:hypothetical protein
MYHYVGSNITMWEHRDRWQQLDMTTGWSTPMNWENITKGTDGTVVHLMACSCWWSSTCRVVLE